jgi:hypothetical protein
MAAHPSEPAQHVRHVRAEYPPVGVALIDDHVVQAAEEAVPARVLRQQRVVQHVRRGEQIASVRAGPRPVCPRRVSVDHGSAHATQVKGVHESELVGRQRPGWRYVQRGTAIQDRSQGRQQVSERFP